MLGKPGRARASPRRRLTVDFQHNIFGFVDQLVTMPISIQRVDGCNNNQTVTYRLLATRGTFSADYTVAKPALVVSFEPD